jgi:hypothetical protein
MDTNHYKQRPGETNATMAARALGVQSTKDLKNLFDPSISVGPDRHRVEAFRDSRNPDRIATVATATEQGFTYNERGYRYARPGHTTRATVSTMNRKEWESAYDRAYDASGTAGSERGDAHFVLSLMWEVGGRYPGRANSGDKPSEEFQPRAPGRIKTAAAAAQTKTAQPATRAHQGDER